MPAKLVAAWREWFEVGRVAPCMDRMEPAGGARARAHRVHRGVPDAYDVALVLKNEAALDSVPELRAPADPRIGRGPDRVARGAAHPPGRVRATPSLAYTPDPRAAFDAVRNGRAAAAVLLNSTKVQDVFAVADAGEVMPPKSTYFVPKVPSGLVVRSGLRYFPSMPRSRDRVLG